MPEPQEQGPWTQYQPPPPSGGEEGPWAKYAKMPAETIEPTPKQAAQPPKKSFLQSVRDWMPEGVLRRAAEKGSEWAGGKAEQSELGDLKAAAHGEPNPHPMSSYSPVAGYGMLRDAMRTASHFIQPTPKEAAIGGAAILAPEITGPAMLAHGGYHAIKGGADIAKRGMTPENTEEMLSGGSEAAFGGAMGGSALARGAPQTFTRNALTTAKNTIIKGEPPAMMVPEAQKALTQAIQPGVNIPRAQESIQIAGPRLKQVMEDEGLNLRREKGENAVPVTKKALDLIKTAKGQVHAAIEDRLGPVAELSPDTSPVADAMENSVSGRTQRQFPKEAEAIQKRAATYRGNLSLREIENSIQDANNELRNFYKRPSSTDSPTSAHIDATLAEVKALRSLLDEKVEALSGEGVAPLKREYGALRDVERATAKQHAIATRTKEGGLWEGLAYLHAAGDLLSGNALGAARAGGAITVGRMLKNLRDPNFLIEQAFHGPKAFEAAEPIAPHAGPPAPKGLLNAPPKEPTPAGWNEPDTSGQNRGQSGRWTTPAAQLPERNEIPATFLREIPRAAREAVRPKGLLTNGEMPPMRTPPPVQDEFATEFPGTVTDETKLGPRGQGGIRIPIKGLLPAAREAMGKPPAPTSGPRFKGGTNAQGNEAITSGKQSTAASKEALVSDMQKAAANGTGEEKALAKQRLNEMGEAEAAPKFVENRAQIRPAFNEAALKAAKEEEPVEVKIKGITAEEPKAPKPKRDVMPPIESRYTQREIAEGEGLLASEAGAMASSDRPGVYYDEHTEESRPLTGAQDFRHGERAGGKWRGVRSGREMYPFMREHPEMNPEAILKALRNKDSAFYKRAMEAAIQFVNRGKNEAVEPETVEPGAEEFPFGVKAQPEEPPTPAKEPEGILPGMGEHVRAQEAGAGKVKAEDLTRQANTPRDINAAAGEMETKSPLFRGTAASPQNEMFGKQALSAAKEATNGETLSAKEYDAEANKVRESVRQRVSPNEYAKFSKMEEQLPRSAKERLTFWKRVLGNLTS